MDPVVDVTIRIGLGLLLGAAAAHKLRDLAAFRATLADYRLLPSWLTPFASRALVAIEGTTAVALLVPGLGRAGSAAAALLLATYAAAVAINLLRGRRHIDCGCFGPAARRPIHGGLVARNLLLVAGALVGLGPLAARPFLWLDAVTVSGALGTLAALHLALDQMMAEAPRLRLLRGDA